MRRVHVGFAPFCGKCRNPFGIIQDGTPIEVGQPRKFGELKPAAKVRALCPGFERGHHNVWQLTPQPATTGGTQW